MKITEIGVTDKQIFCVDALKTASIKQEEESKKVEKKMVDLDIAIREALYQEQDMVKSLNLIKELRLKKLPNIKMTLSKAREHKVHLWHWMKIEKKVKSE